MDRTKSKGLTRFEVMIGCVCLFLVGFFLVFALQRYYAKKDTLTQPAPTKTTPAKTEPATKPTTLNKSELQITEEYEGYDDGDYSIWIDARDKDGKLIARFFLTEDSYPELMIFYRSGKCSCAEVVVEGQTFDYDFIAVKEIYFNENHKKNVVRWVYFYFYSSWELQNSGKLELFFHSLWDNEFKNYKFYCAGLEVDRRFNDDRIGSESDCKTAEEDLNYWKPILEWDKRVPRILKEHGK